MNRRKYTRIERDAVLSVERDGSSGLMAQAVDLSVSGIRFHCFGLEVQQDELLRVHVTLGERTLCAVGRVVRLAQLDEFTQEVALQLVNLDPESRRVLERELAVPLLTEDELEAGVKALDALTSSG